MPRWRFRAPLRNPKTSESLSGPLPLLLFKAELFAVTLALKRQKGSGRVVSDCKGAVKVVAALRVRKRLGPS